MSQIAQKTIMLVHDDHFHFSPPVTNDIQPDGDQQDLPASGENLRRLGGSD